MTGKEYRTITDVKGPLVFLNKTEPVAFGEIVTLRLANGDIKLVLGLTYQLILRFEIQRYGADEMELLRWISKRRMSW